MSDQYRAVGLKRHDGRRRPSPSALYNLRLLVGDDLQSEVRHSQVPGTSARTNCRRKPASPQSPSWWSPSRCRQLHASVHFALWWSSEGVVVPSVVSEASGVLAGRRQLVPRALTVHNSSSRAPACCQLPGCCQPLQVWAVTRNGDDGGALRWLCVRVWSWGGGSGAECELWGPDSTG